ncbi:pseudaminic acid synthase [Thalassotalea euphylliae]|uniref:Pseudaminic acid synthase n=1 Tax=Thalassotalea euphylliae TaxID=1655234 RepID=A0A3E0TNN3_9GAMM|nr:pseudaminic acid synthase [Thalassotalea euphylliae]REL26043.1 pseudaminic acid synthase [Thalassotalea euphylliae]
MPNQEIIIDQRVIGKNSPPYIIAELSANHNGSIEKAMACIDMAKKMGADAVKIQTYTPDTMTLDSDKSDFKITEGPWKGYTLYELYREAHTPYEWHRALFKHARELGITIFSSPFDESAVDLLEELDAPAYKIASFELTDLPLIKYVAKTGKPIIMSTGMANFQEIEQAVTTARTSGCKDIVVLHCISAYPAPISESNVNTIPDIANKLEVLSGLSDHTLGTTVAVTATALGATVIEKHVTLSREEKGPDSEFSLEPDELAQLCIQTERAWHALGEAGYDQKPAEVANKRFRRSIYFVTDIKAGEVITTKHLRRIRPGFGLAPKYFDEIIGKIAKTDVKAGTAASWVHIQR